MRFLTSSGRAVRHDMIATPEGLGSEGFDISPISVTGRPR